VDFSLCGRFRKITANVPAHAAGGDRGG